MPAEPSDVTADDRRGVDDRPTDADDPRDTDDRPADGDDASPSDDALVDCLCPLSGIVEVLGRKYAMQVVCVVGATGTVRFSEIEASLPGASTSTLSARLSELADAGMVARTQYDEIPPRVEYDLTDEGRELQARLEPLLEWAVERE